MGNEAKIGSAVDLLSRYILNGTLLPLQPLRITTLSARYGLSAAPLREALSRLEKKKLVIATANRGWQVAPVSLAEFRDLQIARLALEAALLDDSLASGGVEWEPELVAAHYRLAQAVPPRGEADTLAYRQTWIAMHDSFHIALLAGARSNWLKRFYAKLLAQLQRHHLAVLMQPLTDDTQVMLDQAFCVPPHTELMIAVLDRDAQAATAALQAHSETALEIFYKVLGDGSAGIGAGVEARNEEGQKA